MERHSGNLCFSLEGTWVLFPKSEVMIHKLLLAILAIGCSIAVRSLRVAEAVTGAASRRQQQYIYLTAPEPEY